LVAIWGPALFGTVFGQGWQEAGAVASVLVFSSFWYFVSYPTSNILVVKERVGSYLGWQFAQVLLIGIALWFAAYQSELSLVSMSVSVAVAQVLVYWLSMVLQWRTVTAHS
jgi:O-antigen/teichoic acid export membrane protein